MLDVSVALKNEISQIRSTDAVELVPETLQAFTRLLELQDTTVTPQEAVAAAAVEGRQ